MADDSSSPLDAFGNAKPQAQQAVNVALANARSMLGKNEVPNHAELQQYLQDGGQDLDPHKVAWCAAFVSASLQKAGLPVPTQVVKGSAFGPGAYAPNYQTYGSPVDPKNIQAGDILVNNNGSHVGFAEGAMRQGPNGPEVQMLAGNDRDPSGQYAPGSYTSPTGAVANRAQVGMVGENWVPLSQYSARRYVPTDAQGGASAASQPSSASSSSAPVSSPPGTTLNSNVIDTLGRNIAGIESGGQQNPYLAQGPVVPGRGRAIGKYQVMPENVPGWTLAATGQQMTPDQFRNNPAAQEAVFRDQMQRSLQLYSPADAASIWFTGRPMSVAGGGATDKYTTNASYVSRATAGIPNASTTLNSNLIAAQNAPVSTTPGNASAGASGSPGSVAATTAAGAAGAGGSGSQPSQFMQGATNLEKAMSGQSPDGQGGGDQIRPSPMLQGPPAHQVISPGNYYGAAPAQAAAQNFGQTLNSMRTPPQWGPNPVGSPIYATAGQQGPEINPQAQQELQQLQMQQQMQMMMGGGMGTSLNSNPYGGFGYG